MKIEKPNWTPSELNEKTNRHRDLINETMNHDDDCQCNACMECHGLGKLTSMFSEEEHVAAIRVAWEELEK